ncbi:hypothetical protein GCM10009092_31350 [Bowmanella denitrificans]|uniref:Uncharacterized protein n=1 Tax=Bowmanella denitrificans TaxID=366582 RepID=A0ABN0XI66_9ALTE
MLSGPFGVVGWITIGQPVGALCLRPAPQLLVGRWVLDEETDYCCFNEKCRKKQANSDVYPF